jgi:hypothetical protein
LASWGRNLLLGHAATTSNGNVISSAVDRKDGEDVDRPVD